MRKRIRLVFIWSAIKSLPNNNKTKAEYALDQNAHSAVPNVISAITNRRPYEMPVCSQDGVVFTPSLVQLHHLTDGGQTLHVLRAGDEHSGNYSCRASSRAGTDQLSFSLNVLSERRGREATGEAGRVEVISEVNLATDVWGGGA